MVAIVGNGWHGYDPAHRYRGNAFPSRYSEASGSSAGSIDFTQIDNSCPVRWADVVTAACYGPTSGVSIGLDEIGELERREVYIRYLADKTPENELRSKPTHELAGLFGERFPDYHNRIPAANVLEHSTFDYALPLLTYLRARFPKVLDGIVHSNIANNAISLLFPDHIMPAFASVNVRKIQTGWGVYGHNHFFGTNPTGFWSPENGIDTKKSPDADFNTGTLSIAADAGYKYTFVAPHQVQKVRRIEHRGDDTKWEYCGAAVDPTRPYKCYLGKRADGTERSLTVFVYDGGLSHRMAWKQGGIYDSPQNFIDAVKQTRQDGRTFSYNDLETVGWHHPHAHAVVGSALSEISQDKIDGVQRTFYNEHLGTEPEYEIMLDENSSWSCPHGGQARWGGQPDPHKVHHEKRDCDCADVWNSEWRRTLRKDFDYLNQEVEELFFNNLGPKLFNSPYAALMSYITVRLGDMGIDDLLKAHAKPGINLNNETKELMFDLLELMRLEMVQNTSCGWFFNGIGIAMTLNLVTAANTIQLLKKISPDKGAEVESGFIWGLGNAIVDPKPLNVLIAAARANGIDVSSFERIGGDKHPHLVLHRAA